jgi:hypothetical protein
MANPTFCTLAFRGPGSVDVGKTMWEQAHSHLLMVCFDVLLTLSQVYTRSAVYL